MKNIGNNYDFKGKKRVELNFQRKRVENIKKKEGKCKVRAQNEMKQCELEQNTKIGQSYKIIKVLMTR